MTPVVGEEARAVVAELNVVRGGVDEVQVVEQRPGRVVRERLDVEEVLSRRGQCDPDE